MAARTGGGTGCLSACADLLHKGSEGQTCCIIHNKQASTTGAKEDERHCYQLRGQRLGIDRRDASAAVLLNVGCHRAPAYDVVMDCQLRQLRWLGVAYQVDPRTWHQCFSTATPSVTHMLLKACPAHSPITAHTHLQPRCSQADWLTHKLTQLTLLTRTLTKQSKCCRPAGAEWQPECCWTGEPAATHSTLGLPKTPKNATQCMPCWRSTVHPAREFVGRTDGHAPRWRPQRSGRRRR